MLTAKKPATGIPANDIDKIVGSRLLRAVEPDRVLIWSDIDE
ncbi:MAG: SAF domain-containing protein [Methyloligellaceae bacterium]